MPSRGALTSLISGCWSPQPENTRLIAMAVDGREYTHAPRFTVPPSLRHSADLAPSTHGRHGPQGFEEPDARLRMPVHTATHVTQFLGALAAGGDAVEPRCSRGSPACRDSPARREARCRAQPLVTRPSGGSPSGRRCAPSATATSSLRYRSHRRSPAIRQRPGSALPTTLPADAFPGGRGHGTG